MATIRKLPSGKHNSRHDARVTSFSGTFPTPEAKAWSTRSERNIDHGQHCGFSHVRTLADDIDAFTKVKATIKTVDDHPRHLAWWRKNFRDAVRVRSPNRRPTHPGAILREDVLPALGITQAAFAERLGVSRMSVSELLLQKRSLSPEMAARIAKFLRTTPQSWMRMQEAVDLWELDQHPELFAAVRPIAKRQLQAA